MCAPNIQTGCASQDLQALDLCTRASKPRSLNAFINASPRTKITESSNYICEPRSPNARVYIYSKNRSLKTGTRVPSFEFIYAKITGCEDLRESFNIYPH